MFRVTGTGGLAMVTLNTDDARGGRETVDHEVRKVLVISMVLVAIALVTVFLIF
jgi:hypothetical protein